MNESECPICKLDGSDVATSATSGDATAYDCKRCGCFKMSRRAKVNLRTSEPMMDLSGWVREKNLFQTDIPLITDALLDEIIETLPKFKPIEKQNRLLRAIESMTDYPGGEVILVPDHDVSLAWAENQKEFGFYVNSLVERGYLSFPESRARTMHDPLYVMSITPDGWEYLQRLDSTPLNVTQAFVAMSFDPALKPIYTNAIEPAIRSTGYSPRRVDSIPHLDRIDTKIVAEIKRSRFLLADVTQQKAGVYYEAGFAQGLGLPVIWSVRKDELEKVHFDTRQYNHIVWDSEEEYRTQLELFILATIGAHSTQPIQ